jgi:putative isomerase
MNQQEFTTVHNYIEEIMPKLEKTAVGKIRFPFINISIGQHYTGTVFGWDHHHMGLRFALAGKPQYLRYFIDNLIEYQTSDGYIPNVISAEGPCNFNPPFHAQPFLMQSALMYLTQTDDFSWIQNRFEGLKKYLNYYEMNCRGPYNLFRWPVSWMSGIDNDVVTTFFQPDTIISVDINAWLYLEYRSAANIAARLNQQKESESYIVKAEELKAAVNEILWYDEVCSYSAFNLCSQQHQFHYSDPYLDKSIGYYAFQTCSNLIPLYAGIADQKHGRQMIEKYLLDEKQFLSPFGIRSLSRSSEYFNNAVWGNPPRFGNHQRLTNSNWQGPVWVPLGYFMFHALLMYGFRNEAEDLADRTIHLLATSLKEIGSFTENYDSETGQPLYAPKFASWNILADVMYRELKEEWIMAPIYASTDQLKT